MSEKSAAYSFPGTRASHSRQTRSIRQGQASKVGARLLRQKGTQTNTGNSALGKEVNQLAENIKDNICEECTSCTVKRRHGCTSAGQIAGNP